MATSQRCGAAAKAKRQDLHSVNIPPNCGAINDTESRCSPIEASEQKINQMPHSQRKIKPILDSAKSKNNEVGRAATKSMQHTPKQLQHHTSHPKPTKTTAKSEIARTRPTVMTRLSAPKTTTTPTRVQTLRVKSSSPSKTVMVRRRESTGAIENSVRASSVSSQVQNNESIPTCSALPSTASNNQSSKIDLLEMQVQELEADNKRLNGVITLLKSLLDSARDEGDTLKNQCNALKARLMIIEDPFRHSGHNVCGCKVATSSSSGFTCGNANRTRELIAQPETLKGVTTCKVFDDKNWALNIPCGVCNKLPSQVAIEKQQSKIADAIKSAETARSQEFLLVHNQMSRLLQDLRARNDYLVQQLAQHIEAYEQLLCKLKEAQRDNSRVHQLTGGFEEVVNRVTLLVKDYFTLQSQLDELEQLPRCKETLAESEQTSSASRFSKGPVQCQKAAEFDEAMTWLPKVARQILITRDPELVDMGLEYYNTPASNKGTIEWLFKDWVKYRALYNSITQSNTLSTDTRQFPSGAHVDHSLSEQVKHSPAELPLIYCEEHEKQGALAELNQMRGQVDELLDLVKTLCDHSSLISKQTMGRHRRTSTSSQYGSDSFTGKDVAL